ncbi:hypothetical protein SCL_1443 [Sulfuricaulis limicola]|uniref:Uncharacterized protein n=1 Tax=Sulfuricaulis limicola TaxID=1620215 RepID=A0A1B4XFZ5_9GAMM|nr:hypothetical protein [Sulfuricaulis limicola]BAV33754.1 hypothetical protein SCL_1443 [Sulfuricaulis limicola]
MLNSVSPQVLVALVTALLTAAVTLASVFLTNLNQRKTEEAKFERNKEAEHTVFKREKLEELYLLFSKWDADLMSLSYFYLSVMTGEAQEEDALVSASKNQLSEKDCLQKILMMVNLYFPELKDSFNEVLDARENVWQFCSKALPPGTGAEDFIQTQEEFRKTGKNFMEKIAELTHTL